MLMVFALFRSVVRRLILSPFAQMESCGDRIRTGAFRVMSPAEVPLLNPAKESVRPARARSQGPVRTVLVKSATNISLIFGFTTLAFAQQGSLTLYQATAPTS